MTIPLMRSCKETKEKIKRISFCFNSHRILISKVVDCIVAHDYVVAILFAFIIIIIIGSGAIIKCKYSTQTKWLGFCIYNLECQALRLPPPPPILSREQSATTGLSPAVALQQSVPNKREQRTGTTANSKSRRRRWERGRERSMCACASKKKGDTGGSGWRNEEKPPLK